MINNPGEKKLKQDNNNPKKPMLFSKRIKEDDGSTEESSYAINEPLYDKLIQNNNKGNSSSVDFRMKYNISSMFDGKDASRTRSQSDISETEKNNKNTIIS